MSPPKTMTVQELVELLSYMPPDAEVSRWDNEEGPVAVKNVALKEYDDFYKLEYKKWPIVVIT